MPTGEFPSRDIRYSTHGYTVSLLEANCMQSEVSSLSIVADGSHDLFGVFFVEGPPGLEN